jgi:hypothetical protein
MGLTSALDDDRGLFLAELADNLGVSDGGSLF